jgi:endo-1,4-beta-xylanase
VQNSSALFGVLIIGGLACGPGSSGGGSAGTRGTAGSGGESGLAGTGGGAAGDVGTAGEGGTGVGGIAGASAGAGGSTGVAGTGGGGDTGGGAGALGGSGGDAGGGGEGGTGGDIQPFPALRMGAEQSGRLIGAAISAGHLSEAAYAATVAHQLNFATPENEMKWDATEAARDTFSFTRGDAIVDFAFQHGMTVKGHTMVWHQQLPSWVSAIQDTADMRIAMVNHITQLALHFRGRVVAWDVVNEAVADGGGSLRLNPFLQWLGARYIDDAFIAAHAADPDARLYYNDYGAEGRGAKSDAVYNLVKGMLERGVPIHGVGLQMHTGPSDSPSVADITSNMQRLAALGLEIAISELDVQICNSDVDTQGRRFHDIVAACVAQPACKSVTVWGVPDKYSWRNGVSCATPKPLLFDDEYFPKPAHSGVLSALLGN